MRGKLLLVRGGGGEKEEDKEEHRDWSGDRECGVNGDCDWNILQEERQKREAGEIGGKGGESWSESN
jgi:hypothetical protein